MLVRFNTKSATITMFGDVATKLLRLMGQSGDVPGAILAADIPRAVERLKNAVNAEPDQPKQQQKGQESENAESAVGLKQRAFPLIELLERAASRGDTVMWEDEAHRST
jgi:hypothetical protein